MGGRFYLTNSKRRQSKSENAAPQDLMGGPKRQRGRPAKIRHSEVVNRADDFNMAFTSCKDQIDWERLRTAKTNQHLDEAFAKVAPIYRERKFRPRYKLILEIVKDSRFPKRNINAQIAFLADSIGGDDKISPRTSQNICTEERKKHVHKIIRREFYIECTCGYRGPALDGGCPDCGADRGSIDLSALSIYGMLHHR